MNDSDLILVDLFSGAGGLSLGLRAAGFIPHLAVDSSDMACETYFRNFSLGGLVEWQSHRRLPLESQIRGGVAVARTAAVIQQLDDVKRRLDGRKVALLAGGPPCQGFSLAGLRNPEDQRNRLPFDFLRFVRELRPQSVLIENVTGIGARFRSSEPSALEELNAALAITGRDGYFTQIVELDSSHFGVAQRRPRIMILGLRGDIAARYSAQPTDDIGALLSSPRWSSADRIEPAPLLAPARDTAPPHTVQEAIGDLDDEGYVYRRIEEYPPQQAHAKALRTGSYFGLGGSGDYPHRPPNHALRRHGARVGARFRVHLALAPYGVRENVFGLALKHGDDAVRALQAIGDVLKLHGVAEPLLMPSGEPLLDESGRDIGVNHPSLAYTIALLSTGKHSQRALRGDLPSPTVMSLPDDFVHPSRPRTLTVRELARLQSFPDTFVFYGKVTTGSLARRIEVPQYTQVGNAVPPLLAKAVGLRLASLLRHQDVGSRMEEPAS